MLLEIFSSIKQEEFPALLGVLYFVVYTFLIVYKALPSVEFEYYVRVCDKYVEVWEGRVFACWEDK